MHIGVPTETKPEEYRVAITPAGVRELVSRSHAVHIETGAGEGSAISDAEYVAAGGEIAPRSSDVFDQSDLIIKVKEPQKEEIEMLGPDKTLFAFLHLAAYPDVAAGLIASGATAIAYETVQLPTKTLPLLAPMSEIAGRLAAQTGAHYLEQPNGGRGILLGGISGVAPAKVTVLGAGNAGSQAAIVAASLGANVTILDIDIDQLRKVDEQQHGRITTIHSSAHSIDKFVPQSDLIIGAVLVAGARAPVVVSEEHVAAMQKGSVVVDIAIDQGGCVATARERPHSNPIYSVNGVVHYAVSNIPGAVPNTATYALTNATLPYIIALASGIGTAIDRYPELVPGINIAKGKITHQAVAESINGDLYTPVQELGI